MTQEEFIESILLTAKSAGPFNEFEQRLRFNLDRYEESKKKLEGRESSLITDTLKLIFTLEEEENSIKIPPMICEHNKCTSTHGRYFKRKKTKKGFESEPIFLCGRHASGFLPI